MHNPETATGKVMNFPFGLCSI